MKSFAAVKKQSSIMRSFILDPIVGSDVNILVVVAFVAEAKLWHHSVAHPNLPLSGLKSCPQPVSTI